MKTKRKIGIVGYGYVGKAMYQLMKNHYDVRVYDVNPGTEPGLFVSKKEINECDLGVVCVPTPMGADGACDLSMVEQTLTWLETPHILLKSTVEVGTTDRLVQKYNKRIVFSPEYCGESSYWTPYKFHSEIKETPFFIFGGAPADTSAMIDFFLPITGPVKTYRQTTALAAETAKYMENSFYATKIAFCYEFASICQAINVDFNEVRELWLLDPRINPMHTAVFAGNDAPFSGKCLPKDTAAIARAAEKSGYKAELIEEVLRSNQRIEAKRRSERAGKKDNVFTHPTAKRPSKKAS